MLYGLSFVGPATDLTVGGDAVRSSMSTVPVGFGCGNRMMLSLSSAQVRKRGPFRPLAITVLVFVAKSKRVIVSVSLLTYRKRPSLVIKTPRGAPSVFATTVLAPVVKLIC